MLATIQALDSLQLKYMRVQQTKSIADKSYFAALSKLPEITVPELTADKYEIFTISFCYVIGRTIGMNRIPIDYVMHGVTGNYGSPWMNREDKINNFLFHIVDYFKNDNIALYSIYSQYIGTKGVGYNIINK